MAITFSLDATKLNTSADAHKDVLRDLKVDLVRRPVPTATPLPGTVRPRFHLAVPPIASAAPPPAAPPVVAAGAALPMIGLAPLLVAPSVVPSTGSSEEEAKERATTVDPDTSGGSSEPFSTTFVDVAGAALFGAYAILRLFVAPDRARTEQVFATATAFSVSLAFLASATLFSYAGLSLVDALVGTALVITTLADIAAATRGFASVPVIALIDQPAAVGLVAAFFWWRRARSDATEPHEHRDLEHEPTKETATLLVLASYFVIVPAFDMTLGSAALVLMLQVVASGLLLFGSLPAQRPGSSHRIALLVATLGAIAREVALSS